MAATSRHRDATGSTTRPPRLGLEWLRTYDWRSSLRLDVLAGLTVAAFAVPESMAYASLAGLPPQVGLYGTLLAALAYVFFGTSRQLAIGPTSALAILVATGLANFGLDGTRLYAQRVALVAVMMAVICIAAWLLRLGFVVNFVSETVLIGFSAGAALFIASTQLAKLFGLAGGRGQFFERLRYVGRHLGETNRWALAVGLGGLVLLLVFEKLLPKLPSALLVVLLSIGWMWVTGWEHHGVKIVGAIPRGVPSPAMPAISLDDVRQLVPLALACFLLSYVEGIGAARTFAQKHGYRVDANRELLALGAANLAAGFGQALPVGGSMSRSAVNDRAGARSPLAGGVTGLLLVVVVLFLTGVFTKLPEPILAAVVLVAVRGLIDIPGLFRIYRLSRREFWTAMVTLGSVLVLGMLHGVLVGVILSIVVVLWREASPRLEVLGRLPGTTAFADAAYHSALEFVPNALICRANGGTIFFANASAVHDEVLHLVAGQASSVELVVLDLASSPVMDLSGVGMLSDLRTALANRGVALRLASVEDAVADLLLAAGLHDCFLRLKADLGIADVLDDWHTTSVPTTPDPSCSAR